MKRTPYFQHLMESTYKKIGTEAVKHGSDGAWERLILKILEGTIWKLKKRLT